MGYRSVTVGRHRVGSAGVTVKVDLSAGVMGVPPSGVHVTLTVTLVGAPPRSLQRAPLGIRLMVCIPLAASAPSAPPFTLAQGCPCGSLLTVTWKVYLRGSALVNVRSYC
jgi:hypothetical protein